MPKTKKQLLEEIFYQNASPEERLAYDLKKERKKVSVLENLPADIVEVEKEVKVEVEKENDITGEEIVFRINELSLESDNQISFDHIKNFPWHKIKEFGDGSVGFMGYGAYDINLKAITLGQITANQNNYATGLGSWFRISSDVARSITGFENGTDGRGFLLTNVGSFSITLEHQDASSAASNRILVESGSDLVLAANDTAWLLYDATTERWRAILHSIGGGGTIDGSGTANEITYWVDSDTIGSLTTATYPSLTELSYVKGVTSAIQTQINAKAPSTSPTFATSITGSYLTASEILITDASKNIVSAAVATYPSLTELTYVKGVTSAIQTQINAKANTAGALTQFVGNGNWKVFYADGSGDITELALGADGTFLKSNGAASAPTFATPAGTGDVSKVGTPVDNQVGVWTGDGTIEGTASLTFDGTNLIVAGDVSVGDDLLIAEGGVINWDGGDVTITQTNNVLAFAGATDGYTFDDDILFPADASATAHLIKANDQSSNNTAGSAVSVISGKGLGNGNGGALNLTSGAGDNSGNGGALNITGGASGSASGNGGSVGFFGGAGITQGGNVTVRGGQNTGANGDGGGVIIQGGQKAGSGVDGFVRLGDSSGNMAEMGFGTLTATRIFTFPDAAGTFALGTGSNTRVAFWTATNTLSSDAELTYNSTTNALTTTTFIGALQGNADTVTWADEATDTSCFIGFATAASGSLAPKTNANMTFNSNTGVATFASTVLTTTDINGGTIDGTTIGATSATTGVFTTISGTTITASTGFALGDGDYIGVTSNEILTFATAGTITVSGADFLIADGNGLLVGHTAQIAAGEVTSEAQILGTTETDASLVIGLWSATDALSPQLKFLKNGNAAIGSNTIVADNEELGKIQAYGADGVDNDTLIAEIAFNVDDAAPSAGAIAGEIVFATSTTAGTLTTALTIDAIQQVIVSVALLPDTDGGADLGALTQAWDDLFLDTGATINFDNSNLTLTHAAGSLTLAGGPLILAENTSIQLDPAGSADGKYSGITVTGTGGATIAFGDLITLDKDDSRWELVDISVAAAATGDARGILGMAVTSSTDGGALTILLQGIIRADANFPALTIGASVYASTTGDIVVAQPTTVDHVIRIVGFAMTADEIYFCPENDYITHT